MQPKFFRKFKQSFPNTEQKQSHTAQPIKTPTKNWTPPKLCLKNNETNTPKKQTTTPARKRKKGTQKGFHLKQTKLETQTRPNRNVYPNKTKTGQAIRHTHKFSRLDSSLGCENLRVGGYYALGCVFCLPFWRFLGRLWKCFLGLGGE